MCVVDLFCIIQTFGFSLSDRLDTNRHLCDYRLCCVTCAYLPCCRSRWPRGLRCGSETAGLLGLWVRNPALTWMSVCCECCIPAGRGLYIGLITCPEESYGVWCVCDREASIMRRPLLMGGRGVDLTCWSWFSFIAYVNVAARQRVSYIIK